MKKLLVLFAVCSLAAAAMIPREKRALNEDEVPRAPPPSSSSTTTTAKPKEALVCAATTPCAWAIYHPITRVVQTTISNSYCHCGEGKVCKMTEDDSAISSYVLHCRLPSENDETFDS